MKNKRVVITGVGCLSSLGIGKDENWSAFERCKINIRKIIDRDPLRKTYYAYKAKTFNIMDFIDGKLLKDIEFWKEGERVRDLYYLALGVKLALEDSKLEYDKEKNRIGIVAMHENPGVDQYILKLIDEIVKVFKKRCSIGLTKSSLIKELIPKFLKPTFEIQSFMFSHHLSKIFSLHGYSLFINNACASGLYGVETAAQIIKTGKCSAVVVAVADTVDVFKQIWFEKLGMYSKDRSIKPFSNNANGFILGEGAAAIVLEDLEFARKRNASIYAEYLGGSFFSEGWKVTIPAVWSDFYEMVIRRSLKVSNLKKNMVDVFSPHGIGVSVVDNYESKAIKKIFGPKETQPLIIPFKPYIGHTLGANALLETIFLILCMNNNFIPSVWNRKSYHTELNIPKKKVRALFNVAMKTCCAFGGYLGACVFKRLER